MNILKDFAKNGRNFMVGWYSKHPWITLCLTKKKVFCIFCRYARLHKTLLFSTKYNYAFSLKGYDNMKKALDNFQAHDCSESHMEAKMKWNLSRRQSIAQQFNSESYKQQDSRRNGQLTISRNERSKVRIIYSRFANHRIFPYTFPYQCMG